MSCVRKNKKMKSLKYGLKSWKIAGSVALPLLAGYAPAAYGQTATPALAGTAQAPALPRVSFKQPDTLGLQALGAPLGKTLAQHGVYFTGRVLAEPQAQISGGLKRGQFYEGYVAVGADLDMNKILGIKGGVLHISVGDLQGQPYYNYTGSAYLYNRAWVYGDEFRLAELDWEQTLFNDRVRFIAGRFSLSSEFDSSFTYCQFAYSGCANPAAFIFDKGAMPYLTSSWAGAVTLKPTKTTYIKGGAFADEASLATANHNNWPGPDWDFNKNTGATFPFQVGYITTPVESRYPEHYDIGGFYDTAPYKAPSSGAHLHGRSGVYIQAEKTVWHPLDAPYKSLTVFSAANWGTTGDVPIEHGFVAGFRVNGLWSARPYDSFGLSGQYLALNHGMIRRYNQRLTKEGYNQTLQNNEFGLEANYGIFVAPGMQFTPFVFYALHPEQLAQYGHVYPGVNHSVTVGAAFTINFAQALGMPALRRHPF